MFLQIYDSMTVEEVQDRFTECFPFLKIEFYSKPHKKFEASDKTYLYHKKMLIGDIRKKHIDGSLEIKSWFTTARVEKELKDIYGLNAQIFRWDRNSWIQTSLSDEFTLQQQSQFAVEPINQLNEDK